MLLSTKTDIYVDNVLQDRLVKFLMEMDTFSDLVYGEIHTNKREIKKIIIEKVSQHEDRLAIYTKELAPTSLVMH